MNYTQLKDAIALFSEDFEPGFLGSVDDFIQAAEQKIYSTVQIPAARVKMSSATVVGDELISLPATALYVLSVVVDVAGQKRTLLPKDDSYIEEAFPDPAAQGAPQVYAQFSPDSIILAPVPDDVYPVAVKYYGREPSIVTAGTTWVGDNFDRVLLYGALIEAAVFLKDPEDLKVYEGQFGAAVALMQEHIRRTNRDDYRDGRR